jgi:predicted transcriptional regulator
MTQLTDLQRTLLSTAAARADRSLLPAPDTLDVAPHRVRKAAKRLIDLGFAKEKEVADESASWRAAGESWLGAFITDAGRDQVALSEAGGTDGVLPTSPEPAPVPSIAAVKRRTKSDIVIDLLSRADGASIEEIVDATGWQSHTTRAVLTGLRKKGHAVVKSGERGATRYRIEASA